MKRFGEQYAEDYARLREGLIRTGVVEPQLHFAVVKALEEEASARPTFRERQAWLNFRWGALAQKAGPSEQWLFRRALEQIAAGHNDPRALASETLEKARR